MAIFSRRSTPRDQISINSIAQSILKEWSQEDLDFILFQDHSYGMVERAIRNDYGLWEFDHPLTQHWHQNPDCRNIVDGIDHSEDHPDNVSAEIRATVRSYLERIE